MDKSKFKKIYNKLPKFLQISVKYMWSMSKYIPFTYLNQKNRWIKNVYEDFALKERKYIFLSCARFCYINRPING